ncbi:MAG TPA: polyprenyl synthetase family protein [Firmicutes bacterium]|nr:polyprenyl synthetase family protein [Bacillota bacterium]
MKRLLNSSLFSKDIEAVEKRLTEMALEAPSMVAGPLRILVSAPGKRVRPSLVILCGHLGQYDRERHILAGAAVEAIHLATLIHDDIIDGAETRRGVPTLNTSLGPDIAVFAGDYVLMRALKWLAPVLEPRDFQYVGDILSDLCTGEILQHELRYDVDTAESRYLEIVAQKTSSLFSLSCWLGARLARLGPGEIDSLIRYGKALGIAFQIADDVMDLASTQESAGKPVLHDIRQGTYSLPVIYALRRDNTGELLNLLRQGGHDEGAIRIAVSRIVTLGGIDYAREVARKFSEEAIDAVKGLPGGLVKDLLEGLAMSAYSREA